MPEADAPPHGRCLFGLRMTGIGAFRPLRRVPAIVSFLNPEPALSLGSEEPLFMPLSSHSTLPEGVAERVNFRDVGAVAQEAGPEYFLRPLVRIWRAACRCPAKKQHDVAPSHSMTSSAWASRAGGMVRFSKRAVLRLIDSSNRVGCPTGMSAGLAPLTILSICAAAGRTMSPSTGARPTNNPPAVTIELMAWQEGRRAASASSAIRRRRQRRGPNGSRSAPPPHSL